LVFISPVIAITALRITSAVNASTPLICFDPSRLKRLELLEPLEPVPIVSNVPKVPVVKDVQIVQAVTEFILVA
jgi:hypothetical protein